MLATTPGELRSIATNSRPGFPALSYRVYRDQAEVKHCRRAGTGRRRLDNGVPGSLVGEESTDQKWTPSVFDECALPTIGLNLPSVQINRQLRRVVHR